MCQQFIPRLLLGASFYVVPAGNKSLRLSQASHVKYDTFQPISHTLNDWFIIFAHQWVDLKVQMIQMNNLRVDF